MRASATGDERQVRLAHVRWIGATDAGKSAIARALAERHCWRAYHSDHLDRREPRGHWARVDRIKHPHMFAALVQSLIPIRAGPAVI